METYAGIDLHSSNHWGMVVYLQQPPFYFWRDKTGNEIDLIVDIGSKLLPIEIKASKTYSPELKTNIFSWLNLKNNTSEKGFVIYRGEEVIGKRSAVSVIPWWDL